MPPSMMWRLVCLFRNYFSEESVAVIFWVERIRRLGITLAISGRPNELFPRSFCSRTLRNIPEDVILHSRRTENLKS
jgi:hypothetical protein